MRQVFLFLLSMIPGTVFLAANDIFVKKILREKISEILLLGLNFFLSGIILVILSFFFGWPEIKPAFWSAFVATILVNIFGQLAWYKAFMREEVSLIAPLRLLAPALVLLTGFLVLQEEPSLMGIVGVFVTILGLWFLLASQSNFHGQSLGKTILTSGVLWGIAGAISFSISLPFDKKAVINSSALFFSSNVFFILGLIYIFIFFLTQKQPIPKLKDLFQLKKWLSLSVIFFVSGGFLVTYGLNFALAAYASSVKRLQSLWSVLLSGRILKEGNIKQKIIATVIMISGVAIIVLFG